MAREEEEEGGEGGGGRGRGIITVVLDFACGREKRKKNIRQRDDDDVARRRDQPVDSLRKKRFCRLTRTSLSDDSAECSSLSIRISRLIRGKNNPRIKTIVFKRY